MKRITHLKLKILLLSALSALFAVYIYFDIPCVFLTFLGIPCPGCGMTRAFKYALQLNFLEAFRYNPMFWSVPVVALFFIFDGKLFKSDRANKTVIIILAIGFAAAYLIKLLLPSQRNLFI